MNKITPLKELNLIWSKQKKGTRVNAKNIENWIINNYNLDPNIVFCNKNHEPKHLQTKSLPDIVGMLNDGKILVSEVKSNKDKKSMSFNRIQTHQLKTLKQVSDNGGLAYIDLVFYFTDTESYNYYQIPFNEWEQIILNSSKKSINIKELEKFKKVL